MNTPTLTRFVPAVVDGRRVQLQMTDSAYQKMISDAEKIQTTSAVKILREKLHGKFSHGG